MSGRSTPTEEVATRTATPPSSQVSGGFRPDIQALRAIAVTTVVVYHLWPDLLPGGFIGVDVFFVISGFLITHHLVGEIVRTGRVSLLSFWARRIRRLLPVAFVVLGASLLLLAVVMPAVTWHDNLVGLRAAGAYVVNWQLGLDAVDYLAAENNPSMVLHYWSLAVEEQFYLAWPLLMIGALFLVPRGADPSTRVRRISWVLAAAGAVTFVASLVLTPRMPELAFYATPLRAWEFAAGGLMAVLGAGVVRRITPALRGLAAWVGWATIVVASFVVVGDQVQFPGWIALVPVLAAVLCLVAGDPGVPFFPGRLLRHRGVQWVGDHSYSLYLWHWPFIVAAPWWWGAGRWWSAPVVVLLTVLAAAASTRWIEDPVRRGRWWRANLRRSYGFAVLGAAFLVLVTTVWLGSAEQDRSERERSALAAISAGDPCFAAAAIRNPGGCATSHQRPSDLDIAAAAGDVDADLSSCQQARSSRTVEFCEFGAEEPDLTIAVIGNSHALRLVPALETAGETRHWRIVLAARTDCLGLIVPGVLDGTACAAWSRDVATELAARGDVDVVLFASHVNAQTYLAGPTPTADDLELVEAGVLGTFQQYRATGAAVLVVGDVPGTRPESAPTCVAADPSDVDPCRFPRSEVDLPTILDRVALAHPGLVSHAAAADQVCDSIWCHAVVGGVVVYSDAHHLTTTFSRSLGAWLAERVDAARATSGG